MPPAISNAPTVPSPKTRPDTASVCSSVPSATRTRPKPEKFLSSRRRPAPFVVSVSPAEPISDTPSRIPVPVLDVRTNASPDIVTSAPPNATDSFA